MPVSAVKAIEVDPDGTGVLTVGVGVGVTVGAGVVGVIVGVAVGSGVAVTVGSGVGSVLPTKRTSIASRRFAWPVVPHRPPSFVHFSQP